MIKDLYNFSFDKQSAYNELYSILNSNTAENIHLESIVGSAKALLLSGNLKGIHIVLMNNKEEAVYFASDLGNIIGEKDVYIFPSTIYNNIRSNSKDISNAVQRTAAINAIRNFKIDNTKERIIIVAYPHSILEPVVSEEKLKSQTIRVRKGELVSHDFLKETLIAYGFERCDFVTEPGQYALRGSLIDLFSFSYNKPFRIDFFGDQIENIRSFDINSQRSIEDFDEIEIFPDIKVETTETFYTDLFTFSGSNVTCWIDDYSCIVQKLREIKYLEKEEQKLSDIEDILDNIKKCKTIFFAHPSNSYINFKTINFETATQPIFNKNFDLLAGDIRRKNSEGYKVYIFSDNRSQTDRLKQIFYNIEGVKPEFIPIEVSIHEGFIDHNSKECFYTDHQIFERFHKVKQTRAVEKSERLTINDLQSFQIGDFIVHIDHGIGVFGGLVKTNINGKQQEAIKLIYKDNDVLFVSIHGIHRISRYKSKEASQPKVYKLGTGAWQKLKNQTKSKVKDIAKELIDLYSKRKNSNGFAFSPDTYLQHELEASFIYEDTPDQLKATIAIKEDMEKPYPMDRLICGDVGFGKTELAVRAAFKAVADSKQVAVLVPTTILALQHYKTFSSRLKNFPCRVEYISRLKTNKEIKEISSLLEQGKIDIIIGTHRLLNKEIKFKDLGILIIDEEQKFGVAAKERLRQLKLEIDTLTLSATPIPRTLQFSLLGARDLSIINTPPPNRQPVQTEIIDFNEEIISEAINYELERGGQIFFVHNRIEDIRAVEDIIRRIAPKAKTCVGHGQMEQGELEKIVLDFMMGDYDILVSTTIVENGIDIPNANTIFINSAQNFGLSDLHQLRGRVGRSNTKAFCYLIVPSMVSLTDEARRRLRAIETFSDLGSGFNIAMQDLDIRGAGNMLGGEQSGFIADMGFETYQRILAEAFVEINEERGILNSSTEENEKDIAYVTDCTIDTDLELLIPDSYISVSAEKIRLYKELDAIENDQDVDKFLEELSDRFGPVPVQVLELTKIVSLRKIAISLGIEKIVIKNDLMVAYFVSNTMSGYYKSKTFSAVMNYINKNGRRFSVKGSGEKFYITVSKIASVNNALKILSEMKCEVLK